MGDVISDAYNLDGILPEDADLLNDYSSTNTFPLPIPFESELSQFSTDALMSSMIYQALDSGADMMVEEDSTMDKALDYSVSDWLDYMTGQENVMETIVNLTPLDDMINEQFGNNDAADTILFSNPKEITADIVSEYALDFAQQDSDESDSDQEKLISENCSRDVEPEEQDEEETDADMSQTEGCHITYLDFTIPLQSNKNLAQISRSTAY